MTLEHIILATVTIGALLLNFVAESNFERGDE